MSSDSDSELLSNNLHRFQNESMKISVKGPNAIPNNITGLSFRNNVTSSTMQMPKNFERLRYAESNYDQRSMCHRRETSPMSIMSAGDMRQRNLNNSYYPMTYGIRSQRSVLNGRSGSPMSVRSIDSTASVSAAEIAMAFKSTNFNKYDLRVIKYAYNKYMKHRVRKKIEKQRNIRLFLKGGRRKSGGDSGELGSDSSLSSDGRSTRTSNYKENMSTCRSTKTDILDFRRTIQESNVYTDCTNNFRHNSTRSVVGDPSNLNCSHISSFSSHRSMIAESKMPSFKNLPMPAYFNNIQKKPNVTAMPQKERFKNGFLLPSQRFNKSVAITPIPENPQNVNNSKRTNFQNGKDMGGCRNKNLASNVQTDSDQDDIFSEATRNQKTNGDIQRKRSFDNDDKYLPHQKRTKIASPRKNRVEAIKPATIESNISCSNNTVVNDFIFAKPKFPVRNKSVKEKTISNSAAKPDNIVPPSVNPSAYNEQSQPKNPQTAAEPENEDREEEQSNATHNSTDLSMRPSFIKRKLFTQRLDISEKRNISADSLCSPQNSVYGAIQKEKHKARKLQQVTTQSCLSRDVQQDESNLLDLINKIVPIDQMNVTNQTNKTSLQNSTNKTKENDDKWDVRSILSVRNNDDDESETYTDEEIFNATVKELAEKDKSMQSSPKKKKKGTQLGTKKQSPMKGNIEKDDSKKLSPSTAKEKQSKKPSPQKEKICKVSVEKLPANSLLRQNTIEDKNGKSNVQKSLNTFWDTDFESDIETHTIHRKLREKEIKESQQPNNTTKLLAEYSSNFIAKKPTVSNLQASSFLNTGENSIQKFNRTNLSIRSHRTSKRKKLDQTKEEESKLFEGLLEPKSKKQKTFQATNGLALSKTQTNTQNKETKETITKQNIPKTNTNKTKQTKANKKSAETKLQKEKLSPKTKTTKKRTKQNNSSEYADTIEENNNISYRPIRSCRISNKQNDTTAGSNLPHNDTLNKTLRSRQIDLTSTLNGNTTKPKQKVSNNTKDAKSRLSDISFSLASQKNAVAKRAITKPTTLPLKAKDIESSDISFSLTVNESPTPKKAVSAKSKGNLEAGKKQNGMTKSTTSKKTAEHSNDIMTKNKSKSIRIRTPTRRYLMG